jgi:hypothetical protein
MAASGDSTAPLTGEIETPESGHPGSVKKTQAASTELVAGTGSNTYTKEKQATKTAGEGSSALPAAPAPVTNTPPLLPRGQPIAVSGKRRRMSNLPPAKGQQISTQNSECSCCTTNFLLHLDPRENLPTVVKPEDHPYTAESVASSRDKALVRDVARSIVSVWLGKIGR